MTRSRRLTITLALNIVLVIGQVIFGIVAHSLGLLSDAGHNLSDVAAVIVSLIAVRFAQRAPTDQRSFGYHRATILAALANAAMILAITVFIVWEAVVRLANPHKVEGGIVLGVALGAFVLNGTAALLLRERSNDLNMRSALLHMAGDAFASLGVAIAGAVILFTDNFYWLDPLLSIAIAILISIEACRLVRQACDVLLESTPRDIDIAALTETMAIIEGIEEVHDLHVWSLSSEIRALSAHLVLCDHPSLEEAQARANQVKAAIASQYAITHATLELECESCITDETPPCAIDAPNLAPVSATTGHTHGHGHNH